MIQTCVVVGAGFAGLSAALELARAGVQVRVLERDGCAGGRAQSWSEQGYRFDLGPTLIVLTDVLRKTLGDEAFEALALRRIEPGYRVRFADGASFAMHSDIALALAEFARFEPGRASHALHYLAKVHQAYTDAQRQILEVDHSYRSFARSMIAPGRVAPWVLGNLRRFTQRSFRHPRVVQALTFQSLYLGTSPLRAPAMYALLPVEEIVGGVWFANGGTGAIVDALVRACEEAGVAFSFDTPVDRIENRPDGGVLLEAGSRRFEADGVVVAGDREPSLQLFEAQTRPPRSPRYGHSAMLWYLGIDRQLDLDHHTVLLPDDPWQAYAQLDAGTLPSDPMLYLCNPVVSDPNFAPPGASALLVLAPVPNLGLLPTFDEAAFRERVLARIERVTGPLRNRIVVERVRGPREFRSEVGLMHGAAFGPDHGLDQMGPFRPPIVHPQRPNVVFAGSGTRPGSGIPMVLISGRLAAAALLAQ